ncbi:HEPN domain-containing protein [Bordetella genomosp. 10]|uniref:HEPN domain-containing protein n=1 Tax=Bordetella genomosp. 10 TaxID=1416804 RepID=UPI001178B41F|nr:HEPN domain-containing protein [Bordetella genomosp. 10]
MVKITGKHQETIRTYVESLSYDDLSTFQTTNPTFLPLKKLIISLAPKMLDERAAMLLCSSAIEEVLGFSEDRLRFSPPFGVSVDTARRALEQQRPELYANIQQRIESLPRRYQVCLELPRIRWLGPFREPISEGLSIVGGLPEEFDGENGGGTARQHLSKRLDDPQYRRQRETAWLEIELFGYADESPESLLITEAISIAKQLAFVLGQCKFLGLQTSGARYGFARGSINDKAASDVRRIRLPQAAGRALSCLVLYTGDMLPERDTDHLGRLLYSQDQLAHRQALRRSMLSDGYSKVRDYFKCKSDPDYGRIATAIEWLLDAETADNETLAYLSSCIGLEALIGGGDASENIAGQRLADRYAYTLGRNAARRKALQAQYLDVLQIRGRLVHGRVSKLSPEDRPKLDMVRSMLADLLVHEIDLMFTRNCNDS